MSDEITPALTAEEWEMGAIWRRQHMIGGNDSGPFQIRWNAGGGNPGRWIQSFTRDERHAVAALSLHGQSFGFTQTDVALLENLSENWGDPTEYGPMEKQFASLIARIAALLPPSP